MGIYEFCQFGPQLIISPIVIIFSFTFIILEVGVSGLIGIIILVLGIVIQWRMGIKIMNVRKD